MTSWDDEYSLYNDVLSSGKSKLLEFKTNHKDIESNLNIYDEIYYKANKSDNIEYYDCYFISYLKTNKLCNDEIESIGSNNKCRLYHWRNADELKNFLNIFDDHFNNNLIEYLNNNLFNKIKSPTKSNHNKS